MPLYSTETIFLSSRIPSNFTVQSWISPITLSQTESVGGKGEATGVKGATISVRFSDVLSERRWMGQQWRVEAERPDEVIDAAGHFVGMFCIHCCRLRATLKRGSVCV